MDSESRYWKESVETYKIFLSFDSVTSKKMFASIRERFPNQKKVFDAMDEEHLQKPL